MYKYTDAFTDKDTRQQFNICNDAYVQPSTGLDTLYYRFLILSYRYRYSRVILNFISCMLQDYPTAAVSEKNVPPDNISDFLLSGREF